jgi:hypothetical protein
MVSKGEEFSSGSNTRSFSIGADPAFHARGIKRQVIW